ncbi:MAG: hypothetical protein AABZ44_09405 [Elusimicrobiota bacterium]
MSPVKLEVQRLLKRLPESCSLEDIQHHLYVLQKIGHGVEDVKKGRIYSHPQIKQKLARWLKK